MAIEEVRGVFCDSGVDSHSDYGVGEVHDVVGREAVGRTVLRAQPEASLFERVREWGGVFARVRKSVSVWWWACMTMNVLDKGSTFYLMSRGYAELNPFIAYTVGFFGVGYGVLISFFMSSLSITVLDKKRAFIVPVTFLYAVLSVYTIALLWGFARG